MKPSPPSRYRHVRHREKFCGASLQTALALQPTLDGEWPVSLTAGQSFLSSVCKWNQAPQCDVRLPLFSSL